MKIIILLLLPLFLFTLEIEENQSGLGLGAELTAELNYEGLDLDSIINEVEKGVDGAGKAVGSAIKAVTAFGILIVPMAAFLITLGWKYNKSKNQEDGMMIAVILALVAGIVFLIAFVIFFAMIYQATTASSLCMWDVIKEEWSVFFGFVEERSGNLPNCQ